MNRFKSYSVEAKVVLLIQTEHKLQVHKLLNVL